MERFERFSGKDQMRVMNRVEGASVDADFSQLQKSLLFSARRIDI